MNAFSSMISIMENAGQANIKISKKQYETFCKEYIFDQIKGMKFGKAFCEKFDINDNVLKCVFDKDLAEEMITQVYVQ